PLTSTTGREPWTKPFSTALLSESCRGVDHATALLSAAWNMIRENPDTNCVYDRYTRPLTESATTHSLSGVSPSTAGESLAMTGFAQTIAMPFQRPLMTPTPARVCDCAFRKSHSAEK